jgi:hypothetical protein
MLKAGENMNSKLRITFHYKFGESLKVSYFNPLEKILNFHIIVGINANKNSEHVKYLSFITTKNTPKTHRSRVPFIGSIKVNFNETLWRRRPRMRRA